LSKNEFISLRIYNLLGEKKLTLFEGDQSEGFHKLNLDAANLTSGIYIYSLSSNEKVISKMMILMK
jgi:hypothetical protein